MKKQNPSFNPEHINTILGEESELKGSLHSQGSLRIEGNFEGEIICQGEVYIGKSSKTKANIFAKRLIIAGELTGNVETTTGLKITTSGKLYGEIKGDRLIVEEGGIYKGNVNMEKLSSKNLTENKFQLV